jgi:hypothetical protein
MTRPITDALHSTASLDVERLEAESLVRLAMSVARASENLLGDARGLWTQIEETRGVLERMAK